MALRQRLSNTGVQNSPYCSLTHKLANAIRSFQIRASNIVPTEADGALGGAPDTGVVVGPVVVAPPADPLEADEGAQGLGIGSLVGAAARRSPAEKK
ncbi:hypothetical protein T265_10195 [Opisthorchis viverrini]|uniref:Uncharacterized protein n=1 Tax=Opisthorchis viverrini TaxID=6198 RepID=A0A074Z365_OPIVI|nr:hypothetical protein T265_10195 [Opisthorchis viverrini]KER21506.1 hypothetical protein T265_10195 [Opisthorchis viverrini]